MASGHIQATAQALKSHVIIVLLIQVVKKKWQHFGFRQRTSNLYTKVVKSWPP